MTRLTAAEIATYAAKVEEVAADIKRANIEFARCAECHSSGMHFWIDGELVCRAIAHHDPAPEVGMGASIRYVTDSRAAVITRVTAKTVTVALVETGPEYRDMAVDQGPFPVILADGILDAPIAGTERRFTLNKRGDYVNNGVRLIVGRSADRTDYRM